MTLGLSPPSTAADIPKVLEELQEKKVGALTNYYRLIYLQQQQQQQPLYLTTNPCSEPVGETFFPLSSVIITLRQIYLPVSIYLFYSLQSMAKRTKDNL